MDKLLTGKITLEVGRPTLYDAEFICTSIREHMAQGMFEIEVRALVGIKRKTWEKWKTDFDKPEFRDALEDGEDLCEAFWTKLGREGILHYNTFRESTYKLIMTKKYGYGDKVTVEKDDAVKKLTNDEIEQKLRESLKMFPANNNLLS